MLFITGESGFLLLRGNRKTTNWIQEAGGVKYKKGNLGKKYQFWFDINVALGYIISSLRPFPQHRSFFFHPHNTRTRGIGMATRGRKPAKSKISAPKKRGRPAGRRVEQRPQVRPENYQHPEADTPLRPEIGTQAQFKKKKPPVTYRYDSSLSPALDWDGQNPAREQGEALIKRILDAESLEDAKSAADELKAMSKPFLNWAGKAERLSFDVPTLPLFVHERLSTRAIIETLKSHRKDRGQEQMDLLDLFSDPKRSVADQVLRAYEHRDPWVNRMILGDSLVVMNSLLQYEGLGGQVQMIYIDPPYGVKFGSNFQPFVRKRDVAHNDDEDMTREPEMVQAYRDTWELGLHSYITYLKDRLLISRDLLSSTGSIFVQISDENLHHVREIMDEVFGSDNFCCGIALKKTGGQSSVLLSRVYDTLLWYAKDKEHVKYHPIFTDRIAGGESGESYIRVLERNGWRSATEEEISLGRTVDGRWLFSPTPLTSDRHGKEGCFPYQFQNKTYQPPQQSMWKTTKDGLDRLKKENRIVAADNSLRFVRYINDFPVTMLSSIWDDLGAGSFTEDRIYVVQTRTKAVQRCILMTTDPGDLVIDPTCGSGTTAYVAEQWGRRWITMDCSRVPLALAKQRLLTATFDWYKLNDNNRGPIAGFVYERKLNRKGEEVGGIVPHVTLKSIANDEPPQEEVLVDKPEIENSVVRVSGPFVVEAILPSPIESELESEKPIEGGESHGDFVQRMIEIIRRSPVLHIGNRTITFRNIRPPAKSLSLSAEANVDATVVGKTATLKEAIVEADEKSKGMLPLSQKPVAIVFGPENGTVSEKLVYEAARESCTKNYSHLYVIGFAIHPHARRLIESCEEAVGIPATYVQATLDILMGDLLKNMRSSQIFSVCGLPEVKIHPKEGKDGKRYRVELLGLDVFDPVNMDVDHRSGDDVPAWFLDTDYNGLCFHVCQAFFPRTAAWDGLKRALKATHDASVWDHLSGSMSAPFEAGEHKQIAVKVIDDRGNELVVVKPVL